MNFDLVLNIFYQHIPRRYHRFSREFFAQLLSLNFNVKSAYLFDLFPCSIETMRTLLNSLAIYLPFPSIILKYSVNDLIIVNSSQFRKVIDRSALLIDLNTMTTTNSHPMLDQVVCSSSGASFLYSDQLDS